MSHPKYGDKFTCYSCGTKFYTMKKPEPLCPKCGADQRKAPKKPSAKSAPKPLVPDEFEGEEEEAPLLDEDVESFGFDEDEEGFEPGGGNLIVDDMPDEDY
ncbi:MAG: FYDLN acid domain-containing protein [Nitrospinae bacterium]|nr:FYDLN acid domain-containing protein [Nitrospinota bacterium]